MAMKCQSLLCFLSLRGLSWWTNRETQSMMTIHHVILWMALHDHFLSLGNLSTIMLVTRKMAHVLWYIVGNYWLRLPHGSFTTVTSSDHMVCSNYSEWSIYICWAHMLLLYFREPSFYQLPSQKTKGLSSHLPMPLTSFAWMVLWVRWTAVKSENQWYVGLVGE